MFFSSKQTTLKRDASLLYNCLSIVLVLLLIYLGQNYNFRQSRTTLPTRCLCVHLVMLTEPGVVNQTEI